MLVRIATVVTLFAAVLDSAAAFATRPGPIAISRTSRNTNGLTMEYIPDGLTKAQWAKIKEKEASKKIGKFDGLSGAKFRSRSMHDYMVGRAAGELKPNMPMEFAYEKLKAGKIKAIDIPYMQRPGGKPDNSDLDKNGNFKVDPFTGKKVSKWPWQK